MRPPNAPIGRPRSAIRADKASVRRADQTLKVIFITLILASVVATLWQRSPTASGTEAEPDAAPKSGTSAWDAPRFRAAASWYAEPFAGEPAACGPIFDPTELTAAHRSLPCGTRLLVTHGLRSVLVKITDRGPYVPGRELDLSRTAFAQLAPLDEGVIQVRVLNLTRLRNGS